MPRRGLPIAVALTLGAAVGSLGPARAENYPPPIECRPQWGCFVMKYVDRDPGPGATDAMCRHVTTDGHTGTDFAVADMQAYLDGIPVLAIADGTVIAARRGERDGPDWFQRPRDTAGRDCGNRVAIRHDDGLISDYCHLRRGSVTVREGMRVTAGQPLGLMGLSGGTEFPHLHLSLQTRDNVFIDPLDGQPRDTACNPAEVGGPGRLWGEAPLLAYVPTGVVRGGMADHIPHPKNLWFAPSRARLPAGTAVLSLFAQFYGIEAGDAIVGAITAPNGETVLTLDEAPAAKTFLVRSVSGGVRRPSGFAPGLYRGEVAVVRDGTTVTVFRTETVVGGN